MHYPDFPTPLGVFRDVEKPVYEDMMFDQIRTMTEKLGPGTLEKLFSSSDAWVVA